MNLLNGILSVALTAAPWLLMGLLAAALIKALVPEQALQRWVGGRGPGSVTRAAVMGAPLPLCSCGAIPAGFALYRGGAGRGPTTAFMIGTPGIGVDSLAITYALLGPFMLAARALGALVTAISTGLLVTLADRAPEPTTAATTTSGCQSHCDESSCRVEPPKADLTRRLRAGLRYAFTDLLDDLSLWLAAGLVIAGVLMTLVPPQALAEYGSGLPAMLLMALIGIPLYLCATAATPIAAGMLVAGVSPGTVIVFLLAAPITSMATLAVMRRVMGNAALGLYLGGIVLSTLVIGVTVDGIANQLRVSVDAQAGSAGDLLPTWSQWPALVLLTALALAPLRRRLAAVWSR